MSPVDRAGALTGTNFTLGSYERFQSGFRDDKRPGRVLARNSYNKATRAKNKVINFAPIIALATLIAISLQLNGMLKYDVENTVGKVTRCHLGRRIHPAFIRVTGLKC